MSNGRTPTPVALPETTTWDDDCAAVDVAREFWRFRVEKKRYDKANARAAGMKPGRRLKRFDNFTSHVAIPAMMEAEKGLLKALFELKPPVRAGDEHGASAVRIGDHLVVGFCDADGDHPQLLVIPIEATATVEATEDLHIPRAKRDRWEASKAAGREYPDVPIVGKVPLLLPSGEAVELTLWSGTTAGWAAIDKDRSNADPDTLVTWVCFESRGRTLAAMARRLIVLDCEPSRATPDQPADAPQSAVVEPAV